MHIGLIGSAHFGTDEPFAGGLEALVATLATRLGCGSYQGQGPVQLYRCNEGDGLDPGSCADAVERALLSPPTPPVPWQVRARQRAEVAERHRVLYSDLLARRGAPATP